MLEGSCESEREEWRFDIKKVVSIDYDHTFSTDPITWLKVINILRKSNFNVICCTSRYPNESPEDFDILKKNDVKCYFTSREAKKDFLERQGINVDIWIDDEPYGILNHWLGFNENKDS